MARWPLLGDNIVERSPFERCGRGNARLRGERQEAGNVIYGSTEGIAPEIDVLEHSRHRRFNRGRAEQKAWENALLLSFRGPCLAEIGGVRINGVSTHLDVEHSHPGVGVGGKCFRV